ncbi:MULTISPECIES: SymE family type I addiction module toxin [unclassified Leclercia]
MPSAQPAHFYGKWLEEAEFNTDALVAVSMEQGPLVIQPVKN